MKRLLMLGGAMQQIPAIQKAKELGNYVITCDYLPKNPGHKYADSYFNVSTTDREAVLALARQQRIDGIVAYASDPAAPTAAYVSEQMGISTSPLLSVEILTQKDLFRKFLAGHNFNVPKFQGFSSYEDALKAMRGFNFPVMVKPVDSSGSKGVTKIYSVDALLSAVDEALAYSRAKRFIIEEFIVKQGYQVSGDGFSVDGKLVFTSYGNELYDGDGLREYVALGEFWPSLFSEEKLNQIDNELQRLITALGMKTTAYNIEVIVDVSGKVYILELGPRNGGSYIPQLIKYATGVDLVEYTIRAAMGEDCSSLCRSETVGFFSNYMLLSKKSGRFQSIWMDDVFRLNNLLEVHCTYGVGDDVYAYQNTTHSLGTILFKANSLDEIMQITRHPERHFKVMVE